MQVQITGGPAFAYAEISLPPGGAIQAEAGAMAMIRGDVEIRTSTQGGLLRGLKRSLGGESFFVNEFTSRGGGLIGVAPALPGDVQVVPLTGRPLLVASGSWLASDPGVDVDSKWGGGRGFFSGMGLILLRCTGSGDVLVSAYGALTPYELGPGERMSIDTGHVVAFDESVGHVVRKAGTWKTTLLGGEGLIVDLTGPGRVWLQTRSTTDFISWLASRLPTRSS